MMVIQHADNPIVATPENNMHILNSEVHVGHEMLQKVVTTEFQFVHKRIQ